MKCPECGKILKDNSKFCTKCGYKLIGNKRSIADDSKFWIICVLIVVLGCVIALTCYVAITTTPVSSTVIGNNSTLDNNSNITNITDNGDDTVTIKNSDGNSKTVSKDSEEYNKLIQNSDGSCIYNGKYFSNFGEYKGYMCSEGSEYYDLYGEEFDSDGDGYITDKEFNDKGTSF